MKRDEILNMPAGREMDILISEHVFGMRREKNYGLAGGFYWVGNGVTFGEKPANDVTEYSTDIAAAWEVFEYLSKSSVEVGLSRAVERVTIGSDYDGWSCSIWWFKDIQSSHAIEGIYADTPMLAICRAALIAVMESRK